MVDWESPLRKKLRVLKLRLPTRREAAAFVAVPAEVALSLPAWDLDNRAPVAATAAGLAIAVAAAAIGGIVPGLAALAVGWPLSLLFVADDPADALFALPGWVAGVGAAAWAAESIRRRVRSHRLAESQLVGIRDAASDAIVEVDADGVVVSWSPGAERLYGYSSVEIVGRPLAELVGDGEADRLMESVRSGGEVRVEAMEQKRRELGAKK